MTTETKKPKFGNKPPRPGNPGPQPQTPRRFNPPKMYKDKIMRIAEENDADKASKRRDEIEKLFEKFLPAAGSTIGTAAAAMNKKGLPTRRSRKRGGKMSTGGEVDIDMTTEMDV